MIFLPVHSIGRIFVLTGYLEGEVQAISCHKGVRSEVQQDRPAVAVEIHGVTI